MSLHSRIRPYVGPVYLVMLHTVNVEGIEPAGHCILAVVVPPTKGTDRPAPFPVTLPTLTVPAVSPPCRAFPLRSVNLEFAASHASADVAIYAGFAARIAASGSDGAAYVPAAHTQAATDELPLGEVVPVGHATHAAKELAPTTAEYVPAGQLVHVVDEFAPVAPEYVPAGQPVHAVASATLENVPAAHNEHVPPLGLLEPALHVQKGSPALTVLYSVVISAGVSTRLYI